jgi:hypothetical protein
MRTDTAHTSTPGHRPAYRQFLTVGICPYRFFFFFCFFFRPLARPTEPPGKPPSSVGKLPSAFISLSCFFFRFANPRWASLPPIPPRLAHLFEHLPGLLELLQELIHFIE